MITNLNKMPNCWRKASKPHLFCPGCGHGITLKQLGFAIDEMNIQNNVTFGIDIGCSLLAWNFFNFDTFQTHHGRTSPAMVGYKIANPKKVVIGYMGDGGGYAIGLQSLLHAAFRNNPITAILVNNENYAMTGGQMAPTTEKDGITTTSPNGKQKEFGGGFLGAELVNQISSGSAYVARASVSNPEMLKQSLIKAINNQIENNSFSFVEVLSICPTNWKTNAKLSFDKLREMEAYYKLGELKTGSENEQQGE